MEAAGRHSADQRRELVRRVRHGVRQLSLATHSYVQGVARRSGLHGADVHAVGVLKAVEDGRVDTAAAGPSLLSRTLALSPAAITAMLHRMQANGHLERTRVDADGRRVSLRLTGSARDTSQEMFDPLVEAYEEALADVPVDDLDAAARVLERLADATETAAGDSRPAR